MRTCTSSAACWSRTFLHRDQTFALRELTSCLAVSPDCFTLLASAFFRRLFVRAFGFHFPEEALSLEFLFEDSKRFFNVIVAYKNLQLISNRYWRVCFDPEPSNGSPVFL